MKIEKNIKIIDRLKNRKSAFKYPWPDMKVGDSFYIEKYSAHKQAVVSSAAGKWADRNEPEAKFITRKDGDGIRVFRIK